MAEDKGAVKYQGIMACIVAEDKEHAICQIGVMCALLYLLRIIIITENFGRKYLNLFKIPNTF